MLHALDSIATAGGRVRPSAMGPVSTPRGPVAAIADMFRSLIAPKRCSALTGWATAVALGELTPATLMSTVQRHAATRTA